MTERKDLTLSGDAIDGEFLVIAPRPKIAWSFWEDDLPVLARILGGALAGLAVMVLFHRF